MAYGRGYQFASKPKGPDQVTYVLKFKTMVFWQKADGTYNLTKQPQLNMALLEQFYQDKRLFTKFNYPHPALGNIVVRFAEPLKYDIAEAGLGTVEPFEIKLLSQP